MLFKFANYLRENLELEQATIRLISSFIYFLLYEFIIYNEIISILSILYFTLSVLYYLFINFNQNSKLTYEKAILFVDIGFLTSAVYFGDLNSILLHPIIVWVILSSGIRFGIKSLLRICIMTAFCFILATLQNPYWEGYKILSFFLAGSLVVLPFTYFSLMDHLDNQVAKKTAQLKKTLLMDTLTNIQNRFALEQEMNRNQAMSIILIDISRFQHYNDLYSIKVGNIILQKFALFLSEYTQDIGYSVYRVFGDGFVLNPHENNISKTKILLDVEQLIKTINLRKFNIQIENTILHLDIEVKIGITLSSYKPLEEASIALYHSKKQSNYYLLYSDKLNDTNNLKELLYWGQEIKSAIVEDRIVPVFQPIVDAKGKVLKYEALMRLKLIDEDGNIKLISPFKFLDVAINTNQYDQLTKIMIEKSFQIMSKQESDFSLNISFSDINNQTTMIFLEQMIKQYDIGSKLVLEILESEDISDYENVKKFITKFRSLGVQIAIDDFGAGFSNFAHILEILPEYIKIDGSLIKNINIDQNAFVLVGSIATLASSLGIKTIAEFVYSKEIFEITKQLKIDAFQGYLFSQPLTYEQLIQEKICKNHQKNKEICF